MRMDGIWNPQGAFGGGGTITNGATQWMTAGSGILDIEEPAERLVVWGGSWGFIQRRCAVLLVWFG